MKRICFAIGLTGALSAGLGGCAAPGGEMPGEVAADSYAAGKARFEAGQLGLALVEFEKALKESGPSVDRLNALAATYDRLSRFDLADRSYRQALALDPNSSQTLNNIGYSYLLRGRADLASSYLAKAQARAKGDPKIGANLELAGNALNLPAPVLPVAAEAAPELPLAPAVEAPQAAAMPPAVPERPAVTLLRPQRGTHIEPVAKGVYRLVTIGEEEDEPGKAAAVAPMPKPAPAAATPVAPVKPVATPTPTPTLSASFTIPTVVEPMPAVVAVPVSAVRSEPLSALGRLEPAAGPAALTVSVPPVAGIIKTAATAAPAPFVTGPLAADTIGAVDTGKAHLADALIEVSNGSGIERSGARIRDFLKSSGVPVRRLTNDARFGHPHTVLFYKSGYLDAAKAIVSELAMPVALEHNDRQKSDLRLRLGLDSKPFDNYLAAGIITASR